MFTKGQRVKLHPACDDWMRGDRYGEVVGHSRARQYILWDLGDHFTREVSTIRPVRVKLDKSGKIKRFHPDNLIA